MSELPNHWPQGAYRRPDGSVEWRLWAPSCERVELVLFDVSGHCAIAMQQAGNGYFVHCERRMEDGARYLYRLPDGMELPDPASRWQPDGVHRPSAVFTPERFAWSDGAWRGVPREDLVIYELHVGTFTPEGTFAAVLPRLAALRELGVTALEIMPVAQFPGGRGWGYDGVHPYAVQSTYGGPRGLQELVDAAHREGLAVILDVVYNHLGPEGNYLARFGPYFNDRYHTPWGSAVNYDGRDSDAVREFVLNNVRMWIRDFRMDGLRLDAVQTIFDLSARHILADVENAAHEEGERRGLPVHVIAETDQNDVCLLNPQDRGGYGLDAVWADDFHHALHSYLTGERHDYLADYGSVDKLVKAYNEVFVLDGRYSRHHRRRFGSRADGIDRDRFVVCIQNHDQTGNRAMGDRLGTLVPPEAQRLAAALLLLSPSTPLLFMGEEYGETRPFPFFCSFEDPELIEAVRRGRREDYAASYGLHGEVPDPQSEETFHAAQLSWQWPEGTHHAGLRRLYEEMLAARRAWPALRDRKQTVARAVQSSDGGDMLILERGGRGGIVAIANLTNRPQTRPQIDLASRRLLLSSADERFGGLRREAESPATLSPYEVQIFGP
jgi:maltooligosyltrehalose trehalohydrolase